MKQSERRITFPLNSDELRERIGKMSYDDALWKFGTPDNEINNSDTFVSQWMAEIRVYYRDKKGFLFHREENWILELEFDPAKKLLRKVNCGFIRD